jgi:UDP-N-acetyl-D-glucosamine dehydrogenase
MVAATTMDLISKFESRQATVSVIGLGYVGLPLAVSFADAGFRTIGIDLDQTKVNAVNRGESYIPGIPSSSNGRLSSSDKSNIDDAGSLTATTDYDALREVEAVIVCVPTPLSKTKDPDVSYIVSAADEIACRLRRGVLIVLESTTYPGTTEELILPRLQQAKIGNTDDSPLRAGVDFYLAFSPERIDPGRTDYTVFNTPKVMGGVTQSCQDVAVALYECALERIVPVSSPRVAETVKLLENTFRATNIALVNEFAIMCDYLEVDVWEVIDAAKTKPFGYMPFYPGPGLGGHCIPVDPQYLAWKLKTLIYTPGSFSWPKRSISECLRTF